jgi:MFS-type transporter involved in bile tolerance (Atg22 family)
LETPENWSNCAFSSKRDFNLGLLALQFTGSYRLAILSLLTFFVGGLLILLTVNVPRAAAEARAELPANV